MVSQTKIQDILAWSNAFIKLVNLEKKYFELSINERNRRKVKEYREIANKYEEGISNLIKKLP